MTTYPIDVQPLQPYYGDDPAKQRKYRTDVQNAKRISDYINRKVETDWKNSPVATISFGKIAVELGIDERKVQHYLAGFDGSSDNSIVVQCPTHPSA